MYTTGLCHSPEIMLASTFDLTDCCYDLATYLLACMVEEEIKIFDRGKCNYKYYHLVKKEALSEHYREFK